MYECVYLLDTAGPTRLALQLQYRCCHGQRGQAELEPMAALPDVLSALSSHGVHLPGQQEEGRGEEEDLEELGIVKSYKMNTNSSNSATVKPTHRGYSLFCDWCK